MLPSTSKDTDVVGDEEPERTIDLLERAPMESRIPALDPTKKPYQGFSYIIADIFVDFR